ncbi:MAG TPA: class D beta-lactamase [Oligoflexia bacterium]|nr:class D beta-lactamase [Oligoflexia bacterium]HMP49458.1 class D beta-lactamase [Oligoflexia bacterium]
MEEDNLITKIFDEQGIKGTFLISSLKSQKNLAHNKVRENQGFTPASTFKILNSLIALEEKVISGKNDVIKWNGHIYGYPNWNNDQTLETAFKFSFVWFYQELASRIGKNKYKKYLKSFSYGHLNEPFEETTFWLDDSLKICANEQLEFLKKVYSQQLPFEPLSYEILKQIMMIEQLPSFKLRAKTGWSKDIGWYIGYMEISGDVWFFTMNIDINSSKDLPMRQILMMNVFQALGILS